MKLKFLGIFLVSLLAFVLFSGGLTGSSVAEGVYLPLPGVSEYVYSPTSATKGLTKLSAINKSVEINFGKDNYLLYDGDTISSTGIGIYVRDDTSLPTNDNSNWNGCFSQSRDSLTPVIYTDHKTDWIINPLSPVYTIIPVDNISSGPNSGNWDAKYSTTSSSTITLKYSSNMSDVFDTVSVLYRKNDSSPWEILPCVVNAKSKTVVATFTQNGFGSYCVVNMDSDFIDYTNVSWAQQYVSSLWTKGIMSQTGPKGYFGLVDNNTGNEYNSTRGEFAAMLVKGMRLPVQNWGADVFSDLAPPLQDTVNTSVYYDLYYPNWRDYAYTSARYGIFSGIRDSSTGDLEFQPNEYITREQAAVLIARVAKLKVENLSLEDSTFAATVNTKTGKKTYKGNICKALSKFTDVESISPYALPYVLAVTKAKYMEGFTDNSFRPNGPTGQITRAQSAVIINKLLKSLKLI